MTDNTTKCTSSGENSAACYIFLASDAKFKGLVFEGMKRKYGKFKRPVHKFEPK